MEIPFVQAAQAHEKWFVDAARLKSEVPEFYRTLNARTLTAAGIIIGALALGRFAEKRFAGSALAAAGHRLRLRLRRHAATTVAVTMGAFMVWSAAHGVILAENYPAPQNAAGAIALGIEGVVGALLFLGWFVPIAAFGLAALFLALFFLFPAIEPVDYLYFAGAAVFLFCSSRDRFSAAWFAGKKSFSDVGLERFGYDALRLLTGASLVWLGLGKWLHPELHFAMLDIYADWNPLALLHAVDFAWLTREIYVFQLFAVEVVFALLLLTATLKRPVAVLLMPVFMASTIFLGAEEIIGHLPIVGMLFALAVADDGR